MNSELLVDLPNVQASALSNDNSTKSHKRESKSSLLNFVPNPLFMLPQRLPATNNTQAAAVDD